MTSLSSLDDVSMTNGIARVRGAALVRLGNSRLVSERRRLARLDLLHVEYAVDNPNQPLAVRARDREQAHRARRQGSARIVDQKAERARDRRERRA